MLCISRCRLIGFMGMSSVYSVLQANSFSSGTVSGTVSGANAWESLLADKKNTVNTGLIIQSQGTAPPGPTSFSINGVPCSLAG